MKSFMTYFKIIYSEYDDKAKDYTSKEIEEKLISLIEFNSTDETYDDFVGSCELFDENVNLIESALLSHSHDTKEEENKILFLEKLLNFEGISVHNIANKYKETSNKEIIKVRRNIIDLLKNKFNIDIANKYNEWNENIFYKIVNNGKDFTQNFLNEYKIKTFIFNQEVFDNIIINYQSFNLDA